MITPVPAKRMFNTLKAKQRAVRAGFPEALGLRVHRAVSWLGRAEKEEGDADVRFILLWVAFNSAYAGDLTSEADNERGAFKTYFEVLIALDHDERIFSAVWDRFPKEIRVLLANKYLFAPFWSHQNGEPGYDNWAERLTASQKATATALDRGDTATILSIVFDRLYVLRNQLIHGGATWNGEVNRYQVNDGAAVMGWLLPVFIDIMMDNPAQDWGKPFYPVVD